jgi:hypothetical protein
MREFRPALLAALAALSLSACNQQNAAAPAATPPASAAADVGQPDLLAAAEPFEALTETAFTSRPPVLDQSIATALAAAMRIRPLLSADARKELETRVQAIGAARLNDNRPEIALESVEIYRLLVENAPPHQIPAEVNLLDYAGFRYDADLKARPPHWDDMTRAGDYAQIKWDAIQGRVTDTTLHDGVSKAIADMAEAAKRKDPALASDAVRRELDSVDLLEAFFGKALG